MTSKKRLGRGLDALLTTGTAAAVRTDGELRHLPIEVLQKGKYQPRRDMHPDTLQELADSIRKQGIIQPIVVRGLERGGYEIIAGERRWRAAQLAGLTEVPALIREVPDEAAIAMALIENIQRENLNPLEEAIALKRLLDEFEMTHQQVAEAIGKSRTTVTNILRLLALHPEVKVLLEQGRLEMGHAKALLALEGILQIKAANIVATKNISVRETERLIKQLQNPATDKAVKQRATPDVKQLQQGLSDVLGAAVTIQHNTKGKGKVIIRYNTLDELDGILAHMK